MIRSCLAAVLALGLFAAAPTTQAQVAPKAYAPENLRQLSPADQSRVIEREYADQSNGRMIPDDQREFYLEQVRFSDWTFSRIKSDIAQSLRGSGGWNGGGRPGGAGRPDHGGGWGETVRCESVGGRQQQCQTNFRNRARVSRVYSQSACVEGRSWGQRAGMIWVSNGCRADFVETSGGWGGGQRPDDYSVTCSSVGNTYTTCAWNYRYGRPELIQQLSRQDCVEGRTWGARGNSIWVDRGCRARFGVR